MIPSMHAYFPVMYHSMAAMSAIGGYLGYSRKGCKASLYAGFILASLYEVSAYVIARPEPQVQMYGLLTAATISTFLAVRMWQRGVVSKQIYVGCIALSATTVAAFSAYDAYRRYF